MSLSHVYRCHRFATSALLLAALGLPALGGGPETEYFWVNPTSGNLWDFQNGGVGSNLSNWSLTSGGSPTTNAFPNAPGDNATIEQNGALVVVDGRTITVGTLSMPASNATIDVMGIPGASATLTISNLFTNTGTVDLSSTGNGQSTLTINGGMTNSGTVNANSGPSNQVRRVLGDVTNNGTFDIDAGVAFQYAGAGAVFTNNSTFDNNGDVTFGSTNVFTQAVGTLDNQGSFFMNGDTFNFNGGTVTGNALTLNSSALNIGAGSTGAGSFNMTAGGGEFSGDIAAAQTVTVLGTPGVSATVFAQGDVNNAGVINLDSTGNGQSTLAAVATFTITNSAGGVVNAREGTGSSFVRNVQADFFVNDGTFNVENQVDLTFNRADTLITNNNQFSIVAGGEVDFGSTATFTQAGGNLDNQGDFDMVSDTFNFNGGTITGNTLDLSNSALNIGAGSTGIGAFNMTGAGQFSGDIAAAQTLNVLGIAGVSATTVAQGDVNNDGVINLDTTGNGSASLSALSTFTITNNAGGVFNARQGTGSVVRNITVDQFVNDGTLNVEDQVNLLINRFGTVFTNNAQFNIVAGGEIDFGSNAVFTQAGGNLDNLGDFDMVSDTFNFNGGTLTGNALVLRSTALNIGVGSFGAATFHMTSASQLSGDISLGQTVKVLGISGLSATLTGQTDVQNDGLIEIESIGNGSATLALIAGTSLVNGPGGVLHAFLGTGSTFIRDIDADTFVNHGTVTIDAGVDTTFGRAGGHTTNNSQFTIAATGSVDFGTNAIFTQGGGNLNNLGDFDMNGDTFNFNGGTITGNALNLRSTVLNIGGASTGAGAFNLIFNSTLSGTIAAAQTVSVLGISGTSATTTASAGLTNNGTLNFNSTGNGQATLNVTGGLLANNGQLNLLTGGTVQTRTITAGVVNHGGILVQTNNANFNLAGATHVSDGTIDFEAGSKLTVSGTGTTFTNLAAGSITGSGELQLNNSIVLMNEGTIAPGASAGSLLIDGDLIQTASAQIDIEIGGLVAGTEHDLLTADGDATLAGTLTVNVINGFAPTSGDVYDVFDFTTSSGTFDTILLGGVGNGNTWDLSNLYTDGELIVIRSGDLNSDGIVGVEDLDILLANWGDTVTAFDESMGDATGDGLVNNDDLQIVLDQFGNTTFPGSGTVPEPGTLAGLAVLLLCTTRRRRR